MMRGERRTVAMRRAELAQQPVPRPDARRGQARGGAPGEVREMFLYNPHKGFSGMFTTHPPIEKRIDALVKFAGGQVSALEPETAEQPAGPWG